MYASVPERLTLFLKKPKAKFEIATQPKIRVREKICEISQQGFPSANILGHIPWPCKKSAPRSY